MTNEELFVNRPFGNPDVEGLEILELPLRGIVDQSVLADVARGPIEDPRAPHDGHHVLDLVVVHDTFETEKPKRFQLNRVKWDSRGALSSVGGAHFSHIAVGVPSAHPYPSSSSSSSSFPVHISMVLPLPQQCS